MFSRSHLRQLDTWLAARQRQQDVPGLQRGFRPTVTLNALPGALPPGFAGQLGEYLSSVDDDEPAGWRGFHAEELMELSVHAVQSLGRSAGEIKPCEGCACPGDDCVERHRFEGGVELARELARRGGCVLHFPGACHLLEAGPHLFNVWLEASEDYRISARARVAECDRATAAAMLSDRLEVERRWVQRAPAWSTDGECGYHAAFNLDQLDPGLLVNVIGDTVMEWTAARERDLVRAAVDAKSHDLRGETQSVRSKSGGKVLRFSRAGA